MTSCSTNFKKRKIIALSALRQFGLMTKTVSVGFYSRSATEYDQTL